MSSAFVVSSAPHVATRSKTFSGVSVDDLVEMVEIEDHPFFLASQFHPEFTSNPRDGHPLFRSYIAAAREHTQRKLPEAREA